jgi:hypothetical protein
MKSLPVPAGRLFYKAGLQGQSGLQSGKKCLLTLDLAASFAYRTASRAMDRRPVVLIYSF